MTTRKNVRGYRPTTRRYKRNCSDSRVNQGINNNTPPRKGIPEWVSPVLEGFSLIVTLSGIIVQLVKVCKNQKQANKEQHQAQVERENLRHDHKLEEKTHQTDEDIRKAEAIAEIRQRKEQEKSGIIFPKGEKPLMEGVSFSNIGKMSIPDIQDLRLGGEIYAGDFCLITGATNIGKSIAVMQIAIDMAALRPSSLFPYLPICTLPHDLYIYDAEQRLTQLQNRYFGNAKAVFPSNITRFPKDDKAVTNLDIVFNTMEKTVSEATKSVTWILDNLTFLMKHNSAVQVSGFLDKMKGLRNQMQDRGLYFTLIVVTHTNDRYNKENTNPIKESNIYGSSFLADFADTIICIHRSRKDDTNDKHPYIQLLKTRNLCSYDGFLSKKISHPYAMLKYDDNIPAKLLNGGKKPQRNIDFSTDGVEYMYFHLYLECGMSPREICRLYACSPTQIIKLFKKHYGKGFKNLFQRGEHNSDKGREYFENRMKHICPAPPEYVGEKVNE